MGYFGTCMRWDLGQQVKAGENGKGTRKAAELRGSRGYSFYSNRMQSDPTHPGHGTSVQAETPLFPRRKRSGS